ncbi:MAG: hypothetical protein NW220_21180 [Leptolyngbyaceae cyanobacterium bins.349]|nr:hypothetical protein [Leptolyngbyaceae cyanobacterium bins.349]
MSEFRDRQFVIELVVRSNHPALLEGLDVWLELGLISDAFVRQLCQEELSCAVPAMVPTTPDRSETDVAPLTVSADLLPSASPTVAPPRPRNAQPNLMAQVLQSFMAEISVVWLLFLGVFLVVVSSGVLAATQWQNVAPLGQYSILLVYTLVFGFASRWARQRSALQLTSQMLAIATLLLIPVNFWMMDGLRLWSGLPGIGLVVVAAIALTLLTGLLLRQRYSPGIVAVVILLSWLHWGWSQTGIPFLATYLGTLSAAAVLLVQEAQRQPAASGSSSDEAQNAAPASAVPTSFNLGLLAIALSALLLIGRALFVVKIPVNQLGLAVGLVGWVLCWLARRDRSRRAWSRAGGVLLTLAWLVTVSATPPWQAILVSGLGVWLLVDVVWRTGRSLYLATGFLVGLQGVWLLWRLLPAAWLTQLTQWATSLAGSEAIPFALWGIGFFPYVWFTLGFAVYLRRKDRLQLAGETDGLALALGGLLTAISFGNPLVRSLTLTLATLTLITTASYRRPRSPVVVYLAHGTALATLFAWINYHLPQLNTHFWMAILLLVMALEWGYSALRVAHWGDGASSSWHLGLGLAGVSYALWWDVPSNLPSGWKLAWMLTPVLLTGLSYRDRWPMAPLATGLSVLALGLAQPVLIWETPTRLASLGIATVLMLFNTARLQQWFAAVITVGLGLGFWVAILEAILPQDLAWNWIIVLITLTLLLLWGWHGVLLNRRSHLSRLYRWALDGWAIAVLLLAFFLLGLTLLLVYLNFASAAWQFILAGGMLVAATTYRTWQRPSNGGWMAIAWSVELLTVSVLLWAGRSLLDLAIANITLGFLAQLAGDGWQWAVGSGPRAAAEESGARRDFPFSWHLIPLAYGLLGLGLARTTFTATTGFYTLAVAVLGCLVGRRSPGLQPITYLSLAGLSLGAYDLLIYPLLQAKGGHPGDGMTLLAGLAIALAFGYLGGQRQLVTYLRLGHPEFNLFTRLHWVLGHGLLAIAVSLTLSRSGQVGWTVVAALLALFALVITHQRSSRFDPSVATGLMYVGILDVLAAIASLLWLLVPTARLLDWAGAIATIVAIAFYYAPWRRWGWVRHPWRQVACWLPGGVVLLVGGGTNLQTLLVVAAFYAGLASAEQRIRFSYISVLFTNWALFRLLLQFNVAEPLWYVVVIGSSLLYLAQVDPMLQTQQRSEQRHWLRSLATALICLTGFYQAETGITGLSPFVAGGVAIAIEFGFIVLGLWQRVRAFLYVGTLTFILQILWQLWRFVSDYSLLLWLLGIVLGLILIWVAATFEARRAQANALLQHWVAELEDWQ